VNGARPDVVTQRREMRVLHVLPSVAARVGGPAHATVTLCVGLQQAGVPTTIVGTDMPAAPTARLRGAVRAEDLPPGADSLDVRLFPASRPFRLAYSKGLASALWNLTPQHRLVHIHSVWLFPQFAAYRAASSHGTPWVVSLAGAFNPWLRRRGRTRKRITMWLWQEQMLRDAAAIVCTSDEEARLASDIAPGVPRAILPNPIDWERFQDLPGGSAFRQRFSLNRNAPLVIFTGRLARVKGLELLIDAFAQVLRAVPDAYLVLVGPDDEGLIPELTARAHRRRIQGRCIATGNLNGAELLAALSAADVCVLPSHNENFGVAGIEALAAGRSLVISPGVNIAPELHAASVAVIAEREPFAFAQAIVRCLTDHAYRRGLEADAREFARRYDRAVIAEQAARIYESIVDGDSPHALSERTSSRLCASI
jgi:glycosyltransferase involved in cell wall biosynthesis